MANIFTGCGADPANVTAASTTYYYGTADCDFTSFITVEAQVENTCRSAGTYSNLAVDVPTNARSTATTLTFRKNNANTSLAVSIAGSTTGIIKDITDTVSVADGDTVAYCMVTGTGSGAIAVKYVSTDVAVTSGSSKLIASMGSAAFGSASSTTYTGLGGRCRAASTELQQEMIAPAAGTLSNLQVYVSTNPRTTTTTVGSRINSANGNQSVSVGSTATGYFEDVSNTDSVSIGDTFNGYVTTGTGTGTFFWTMCGCLYETDGSGFPIVGNDNASNASTYYVPAFGGRDDDATESNVDFTVPFAVTAENFATIVDVNNSTVSTTIRTRINGSNGNQSVTVTASSTGLFQDTTNSDSISADDLLNYQVTGQDASIQTRGTTMFLTEVVSTTDTYYGCIGLVGYV